MAKKQPAAAAPIAQPKHIKLDACVVHDHQRRTAIVFDDDGETVSFIPLSYENGLEVESLSVDAFAVLYPTVMADYPVERAATLYVQYSHSIGASDDALEVLGRFIKLTKKDIEMATKKPAAKAAAKTAKGAPAKKTTAKAAKAAPAAKGEAKAPRESAAAMFKELIMAGNLTDAKIFEKVSTKFGLDEKKKTYVAWYRNKLTKDGANPPAAKG